MSRSDQVPWRTALVGLLVTVFGLAIPLGVLAGWTASWLNTPDRFVATMSSLRGDPDVQLVVADATAAAVVARLDVEALTSQWLSDLAGVPLVPPRTGEFLPSLSGPLTAMVEDFVRGQVLDALASDRFAAAWDAAALGLHRQVTALLDDDQEAHVVLRDGRLQLRLDPFVAATRDLLLERGFALARLIPDTEASLPLVEVDERAVAVARTVHRGLGVLVFALPAIAIAALAGAILLEGGRRRVPAAAGFLLAGGTLLLLGGLGFVSRLGTQALVGAGFTPDGAGSVIGLLFGELQAWLWWCVVAAVVLTAIGLAVGARRAAPQVAAGG